MSQSENVSHQMTPGALRNAEAELTAALPGLLLFGVGAAVFAIGLKLSLGVSELGAAVLQASLSGLIVLTALALYWRSHPPVRAFWALLWSNAYLCVVAGVFAYSCRAPGALIPLALLLLGPSYYIADRRVLGVALGIGVLCTLPTVIAHGNDPLVPEAISVFVVVVLGGLAIHLGRVRGLVALDHIRLKLARQSLEQQETEAQLLLVRKRESLGTMASGVAHDFNNHLTSILGGVELSTAESADSSAVIRGLAIIRGAAVAAQERCKFLLDYAGGQNPVEVRLELNELLHDALGLSRLRLSTNVTLRTDLSELPLFLLGDRSALQHACINLVNNAAEAMGASGGEITVSTKTCWLDEVPHAALLVSDTGPGIALELRDKIFDPFFTTRSEGRGLGLASVAATVQTMHGTVATHSGPGDVGTTFELILPLAGGVARVEQTAEDQVAVSARAAIGTVSTGMRTPQVGILSQGRVGGQGSRDLEHMFTAVFDQLPSLVIHKDRANTTLRVNRAMAALKGITPTDMANTPTQKWHPEEAEGYFLDDQEVIRTGQPKTGIHELIEIENGRKDWFVTDKVPVFEADGSVSGVLVFSRHMFARPVDVTPETVVTQGERGIDVDLTENSKPTSEGATRNTEGSAGLIRAA